MAYRQTVFQAIGTQWSIQLGEDVHDEHWKRLLVIIQDRIDTFDRSYSRFRSDSLVTRISQKAGSYVLPVDGFDLLRFYEALYTATNGKVTPLIGQTLADAGYDATYSFEEKPLQRPPDWEDIITYDERRITVSQPVLLDFGAAGKGYLVDIIGQIIEAAGVRSFSINAGGDMLHRGPNPAHMEVGLENPTDTTEVIGTVRLANQSLCASAGSKRRWGTYHHIIDPVSLQSPKAVIATWVLADTTMLADGLASALFFTDPAALRKQFSFSYALLDSALSLYHDKAFPVRLFEAQP